MNKLLKAAGVAALGLMLAGCGGSGNGDVAKPVTSTCSTDMMGMTLKMVFNAPAADQEIDSMDYIVEAKLEDMGISEDMMTDEMMDAMKEEIVKSMDTDVVDKDKVEAEVNNGVLTIRIPLENKKEIEDVVGSGDSTFSTVISDLEDQGITCE